MSEIDDELFMMTHLFPATAGLPTAVRAGPRYGVRHDVRSAITARLPGSPFRDPCVLHDLDADIVAYAVARPHPHHHRKPRRGREQVGHHEQLVIDLAHVLVLTGLLPRYAACRHRFEQ